MTTAVEIREIFEFSFEPKWTEHASWREAKAARCSHLGAVVTDGLNLLYPETISGFVGLENGRTVARFVVAVTSENADMLLTKTSAFAEEFGRPGTFSYARHGAGYRSPCTSTTPASSARTSS